MTQEWENGVKESAQAQEAIWDVLHCSTAYHTCVIVSALDF